MTTKNHGYSYRAKIVKRVIISLLLVFVLGLMNAHAQSRLTPISGAIYYGKGDLTDYEVEINSLLLPSYYRFAYIVKPSFHTEYSLVGTGDGDSLILRKAEIKIWPLDKPKKVSVKEYKLQVSPAISDSISNLFKSAVLSSSYLSHKDGVDGTTFVFISWPYTAECHSPFENSNCGKLVALADSICKAVELHNSRFILDCLKDINQLHFTFKTLYNEKPSEENTYVWDNSENKSTHFQGNHFIIFLFFTFLFFIIIGILSSITLLFNKKRRMYWWIPLLVTIILCIVIGGIAYSLIAINSIEL